MRMCICSERDSRAKRVHVNICAPKIAIYSYEMASLRLINREISIMHMNSISDYTEIKLQSLSSCLGF